MAKFIGHTIPGTLFSLLGTWWTYNIWMRYFISQKALDTGAKRRSTYTNIAGFPCPCRPRIPIEGIFKATIVPFGMLAEYLTAFDEKGKFTGYNNLQHLTMYFYFGLNGVVDILTFYKWPIPRGTDYASAILGFSIEGLLFYNHLHGRSMVDRQMHVLLLYVIIGCGAMTLTEVVRRHSVLSALARCYFIILQGSWLLQMAFLLYWPFGTKWQTDNHVDVMVVSILFCWHCAGIFVSMIVSGLFTYWRVKRLSPTSVYFTLHPLVKSLDTGIDSLDVQQVRSFIADSEEEDFIGM